eukprot:GHVR01117693.1.p1 GENE.GHVR01117693.1~~GHVR01117693.1.p1  ORF type:complete len:295 (+),score=33.70 GHVR01117693.1:1013-1897(+)
MLEAYAFTFFHKKKKPEEVAALVTTDCHMGILVEGFIPGWDGFINFLLQGRRVSQKNLFIFRNCIRFLDNTLKAIPINKSDTNSAKLAEYVKVSLRHARDDNTNSFTNKPSVDSQKKKEKKNQHDKQKAPSKTADKITTKMEPVHIYTDGAANGKWNARAGVGVFFGEDDPRNISRPLAADQVQTNNRAELDAIREAVYIAIRDHSDELVYIHTDSEYSIKCLDFLSDNGFQKKWRKNDWKTTRGTDVKNADLIQEITRDIQQHRGGIHIRHVTAHGDSYGNNQADHFARRGMC